MIQLGINNLSIGLIGGAKKYKVNRFEPNFYGSMLMSRPEYKKIILEVSNTYDTLVFMGDNFCCDLLLPHSFGHDVYYIPNHLTHPVVLQYISDNKIKTGRTEDIVRFLITKGKE